MGTDTQSTFQANSTDCPACPCFASLDLVSASEPGSEETRLTFPKFLSPLFEFWINVCTNGTAIPPTSRSPISILNDDGQPETLRIFDGPGSEPTAFSSSSTSSCPVGSSVLGWDET